MTGHRLDPAPATTVQGFSRELPPVLMVEPGNTVLLRSLDAAGHLERQQVPGQDVPTMFAEWRGHCLTGPIEVRGARPGDVLAARFVSMRPDDWGWTRAGGRDTPLDRRLGLHQAPPARLLWPINADAGVATSDRGTRCG
jgi:hypothetical protein